ncbi:MAG: hypothetical protein ACJA0Q_000414 [Saprospiraceae bacterium]|jgi:hypothetical protein
MNVWDLSSNSPSLKKRQPLRKYIVVLIAFLTVFQLNGQDLEAGVQTEKQKWFYSIGGSVLFSYGNHLDDGFRSNFLTFAFQIRRNILSFDDDASFSLSAPLQLSLSSMMVDGDEYVGFPLTIPLLLDFNLGMHATYNNIDSYGFSLSAGLMTQIIPNMSGELKTDVGPGFKMEIKFPRKRRNFSFYTLVGMGFDENSELKSHMTTIGVFYLMNYGN